MFEIFKKEQKSIVDEPIEKVLDEMNVYGPDSEEYERMLGYLERLNQVKANEPKHRISPDTMAIVLGNLIGIMIIVIYEQKHVLVSKGVNFVLKPKGS